MVADALSRQLACEARRFLLPWEEPGESRGRWLTNGLKIRRSELPRWRLPSLSLLRPLRKDQDLRLARIYASQSRPRPSLRVRLTPPRVFLISFIGLILLGTVGLMVLPGLQRPEREPLGWLDTLFMATSAVCVTGLSVVDVADQFTIWGQVYLLGLIQLGGLGFITFSTLIVMILGSRFALERETVASTSGNLTQQVDVWRLARQILGFTLLFEMGGATALFLLWGPLGQSPAMAGETWPGLMWEATFHAISAFCNAGFSVFGPSSLEQFQRDPLSLAVIMVLIVVGGLGFFSITELKNWMIRRCSGGSLRISLHTRVTVIVSGLLIVGGALFYALLEWNSALGHLGTIERVWNALMCSITTRTAGFHAIPFDQMHSSTQLLTMLWMFVGGAPGSTAGGLKITTLTVLWAVAWSRVRGYRRTSLGRRSIPAETIQRASGLFVGALVLASFCLLLLLIVEPEGEESARFLELAFETASALNTVGLSLGVTGDLTPMGRAILIFLMLIGRVGLAFTGAALAFHPDPASRRFRYAYENVVVG